jgi:ribosomal protein RSM22 (predicted rRNA methylase)
MGHPTDGLNRKIKGGLPMELPLDLRTAIDGELAPLPSNRLATLVAELSKRYRTGPSASGGKFLRSPEDVIAYAAFRLPATFAAVYAALRQVKDRLPDWRPQTLLDVGAGPGTAMWATATLLPNLDRITLLEREDAMIALGKRLASYSSLTAVQAATWVKADITGAWESSPHDLVIASYVIGELPQDAGAALIRKLWANTSGTLVIIEPGTPAGFARIKRAREQLLLTGGTSIAPCPHDRPCPMAENDWCHFSQRVARSRLHRQVKAGELSYEDEKFSFVSVSRTPVAAMAGRVIRHPQIRPGHIRLELCTAEGLTSTVVTRKDRALFRAARDLNWGSVMPSSDETS